MNRFTVSCFAQPLPKTGIACAIKEKWTLYCWNACVADFVYYTHALLLLIGLFAACELLRQNPLHLDCTVYHEVTTVLLASIRAVSTEQGHKEAFYMILKYSADMSLLSSAISPPIGWIKFENSRLALPRSAKDINESCKQSHLSTNKQVTSLSHSIQTTI